MDFLKAKTLRELPQFLSLISRDSALHPTFSVSKYWYGVTLSCLKVTILLSVVDNFYPHVRLKHVQNMPTISSG